MRAGDVPKTSIEGNASEHLPLVLGTPRGLKVSPSLVVPGHGPPDPGRAQRAERGSATLLLRTRTYMRTAVAPTWAHHRPVPFGSESPQLLPIASSW